MLLTWLLVFPRFRIKFGLDVRNVDTAGFFAGVSIILNGFPEFVKDLFWVSVPNIYNKLIKDFKDGSKPKICFFGIGDILEICEFTGLFLKSLNILYFI